MWGIVALQVRFICVDANQKFIHVQVVITVVMVIVIMVNVARQVQVPIRGVSLNTISTLKRGLVDLLSRSPFTPLNIFSLPYGSLKAFYFR